MGKDVSLHFEFKSSIEKVWNAFTDSNALAKWLYANDFKPVVGHKISVSGRTDPMVGWNYKL